MPAHKNDNMTGIGHCLLPIKRFHHAFDLFNFHSDNGRVLDRIISDPLASP
jgi:hypothetical protein